MNELLFIITILLCFITTLIFYKFMGMKGLYTWIAIVTIISNIQTVKLVNLFTIETALGTVLYASAFLATDILNEKYGKQYARKSVLFGFASMLTMTIFMTIALLYTPSKNDFANESLKTIFTFNIRITIASTIAFVFSQLCDTYIYDKLKAKKSTLLLRNNLSTIISQMMDTLLFVFITYLGVFDFKTIIEIMAFMYLFKFIIALLDTPFMYIAIKLKPNDDREVL